MEEVVYRRYKRLLDEEKPLPQLIIIDGGKGQLSSSLRSLEALGLRGKDCDYWYRQTFRGIVLPR